MLLFPGDFLYTRFRYPRVYFSIISINILSVDTVEAAAKAHWSARAVSLTGPPFWLRGLQIKASHGTSLRKSTGIPVLRVFHIRGYSQESNPRV
jgi:hypothetical protein